MHGLKFDVYNVYKFCQAIEYLLCNKIPKELKKTNPTVMKHHLRKRNIYIIMLNLQNEKL